MTAFDKEMRAEIPFIARPDFVSEKSKFTENGFTASKLCLKNYFKDIISNYFELLKESILNSLINLFENIGSRNNL